MPKRKSEEKYDKLLKKFKRLEKKLMRQCTSRSRSRSRSTSENRHPSESQEPVDYDVVNLLDEAMESRCGDHTVPTSASSVELAPAQTTRAAMALPCGVAAPTGTVDSCPAGPIASTSQADQTELSMNTVFTPNCDDSESTDIVLDGSILEILGEDPTITPTYGAEIHKDLAVRLEHIATQGLPKELRKELGDRYLLPSNCKLIDAPCLNAEIKVAISEINAKRDKHIEIRQKHVSTAIACLSQALNKLFCSKNTDSELIKLLMDAERILCDSQYNDTTLRRSFILSALKKDIKDQLSKTKPDCLLFGQNLGETVKTAKAIYKSGVELRPQFPKPLPTSKKPPAAVNTTRHLNWKGPYPPRKSPSQPKTREFAPPPQNNKNRPPPPSSSRHSQPYPTRGRR